MSALLVENKVVTDKNFVFEMWVDHFGALSTPSVHGNFDSNFLIRVSANVADIL